MVHTSEGRRRLLLWAALLFLFGLLLRNPVVVREGMAHGFTTCVRTLIPALFPFLVLTNLFAASGLSERLGALLARPCRLLFGFGPACGAAVLVGALSGYPVGASVTVSLYQKGLCTRKEAERMLAVCNNAGPAFLISGIGGLLWGDIRIGILLYAAQLFAALVVGIAFRLPRGNGRSHALPPPRAVSLAECVEAVPRAAKTMLTVCGFVLFFDVLFAALLAADVFAALPLLRTLCMGICEVSAGAGAAAVCFGMRAPVLGVTLTALFAGWSGLSVHLQVAAIVKETDLSLGWYLRGKAVAGLLAGGFALAGATFLFT